METFGFLGFRHFSLDSTINLSWEESDVTVFLGVSEAKDDANGLDSNRVSVLSKSPAVDLGAINRCGFRWFHFVGCFLKKI